MISTALAGVLCAPPGRAGRVHWSPYTRIPSLGGIETDAAATGEDLPTETGSWAASRVVSTFGEYVDLTALHALSAATKGAAPRRLLQAVQRFHTDSLAGQCYASFRVSSRNFMETSERTELWINECNQRFDRCVALGGKGHHAEVLKAEEQAGVARR